MYVGVCRVERKHWLSLSLDLWGQVKDSARYRGLPSGEESPQLRDTVTLEVRVGDDGINSWASCLFLAPASCQGPPLTTPNQRPEQGS